jgi:hypothetical protein
LQEVSAQSSKLKNNAIPASTGKLARTVKTDLGNATIAMIAITNGTCSLTGWLPIASKKKTKSPACDDGPKKIIIYEANFPSDNDRNVTKERCGPSILDRLVPNLT